MHGTKDINKIFKTYTESLDDDFQRKVRPLMPQKEENVDLYDLLNMTGHDSDVNVYDDTDLPAFNYKQLLYFVDLAYSSKLPILIYGEPGLGKSSFVQQYCIDAAEAKGKKYVNWTDISVEEQDEVLRDPGRYFVLVDVRTADKEPTSFSGIPTSLNSTEPYLVLKQEKWIYLLSKPNADGIIFLDEINQGHPQVIKALFEVALDRKIGGTKYATDICVMAAGNLRAEHGNEPLPPALTSRFDCGVLIADPEGWLDWAKRNNLNEYIVRFVESDPAENFYVRQKNANDPYPTPRNMTKLSKRIDWIVSKYNAARSAGKQQLISPMTAIHHAAAQTCGETWARKFLTFLKYVLSYNLQSVKSNLKTLKTESPEKLHALVSYMVTTSVKVLAYLKSGDARKKQEALDTLETFAQVTVNLSSDWANTIWFSIRKALSANLEDWALLILTLQDEIADPALRSAIAASTKRAGESFKPE